MVFNGILPSFGGLAESGWAALGCVERGQNFILQVDLAADVRVPSELAALPAGERLEKDLQGWATRSRFLVHRHASEFRHPRFHVVADVPAVVAGLRDIYGAAASTNLAA
jgi:hypothetical protein